MVSRSYWNFEKRKILKRSILKRGKVIVARWLIFLVCRFLQQLRCGNFNFQTKIKNDKNVESTYFFFRSRGEHRESTIRYENRGIFFTLIFLHQIFAFSTTKILHFLHQIFCIFTPKIYLFVEQFFFQKHEVNLDFFFF